MQNNVHFIVEIMEWRMESRDLHCGCSYNELSFTFNTWFKWLLALSFEATGDIKYFRTFGGYAGCDAPLTVKWPEVHTLSQNTDFFDFSRAWESRVRFAVWFRHRFRTTNQQPQEAQPRVQRITVSLIILSIPRSLLLIIQWKLKCLIASPVSGIHVVSKEQ